MMKWKRIVSAAVCVCMAGMLITGCGSKSDSSSKKRIIRVALSQSEEHPEYKGMETFKKYVEEKLGDKYEVQLYPNELLGGQTKAIELTQTGAILRLPEHRTLKYLPMYMKYSVCRICLHLRTLILQL